MGLVVGASRDRVISRSLATRSLMLTPACKLVSAAKQPAVSLLQFLIPTTRRSNLMARLDWVWLSLPGTSQDSAPGRAQSDCPRMHLACCCACLCQLHQLQSCVHPSAFREASASHHTRWPAHAPLMQSVMRSAVSCASTACLAHPASMTGPGLVQQRVGRGQRVPRGVSCITWQQPAAPVFCGCQ